VSYFIKHIEDLFWWNIHCRYSWTHQKLCMSKALTKKVSGVQKTLFFRSSMWDAVSQGTYVHGL
jgi:hypothetical protein